MAKFTVRVELHNASSSDYNRLHVAMDKIGFKHDPPPTGEYVNRDAEDISVWDMKTKIKTVVDGVHKSNSGTIAKGDLTAW